VVLAKKLKLISLYF